MENDQDYISKMVDDTFNDLEASDNVLKFERSETNKNQEFEQLNFEFSSYIGHLDNDRQCMVLSVGNEVVEIPLNWGPFKLYNFKDKNLNIIVEKHDDVDLLLDVLSELLHEDIENIQFTLTNQQVRLIINQLDNQSSAA